MLFFPYMIISLSGNNGSGKSTIARQLAEKFSWPHYSMGDIRRRVAKKMGLTLAEYNKLGEHDPKTDKPVDDYQIKLGQKKDNFIIDGRLSWYFIPHSFKIFLYAKPEIGAKRIYKDVQNSQKRNEDRNLKSEKDVLKSIRARVKSDKLRYKKYYNLDPYKAKNYDLYLDTSFLTPAQVFRTVLKEIKASKGLVDKK